MNTIVSSTIRHRISNAWVYYQTEGIFIKPFLHWKSFHIPWELIHYISPTPAVKCTNTNWHTFDQKDLMPDNALQQMSFLHFHIVVEDYRKLNYGDNVRQKLWGFLQFPMYRSLINASDEEDPKKACLRFEIKKNSLNVPLRTLLDYIKQHSKYDLLCL